MFSLTSSTFVQKAVPRRAENGDGTFSGLDITSRQLSDVYAFLFSANFATAEKLIKVLLVFARERLLARLRNISRKLTCFPWS